MGEGGFDARGLGSWPALRRLRRFALSSKSSIVGFFVPSSGAVGLVGASGSRKASDAGSALPLETSKRISSKLVFVFCSGSRVDDASGDGDTVTVGGVKVRTGVCTPYCLAHLHSLG